MEKTPKNEMNAGAIVPSPHHVEKQFGHAPLMMYRLLIFIFFTLTIPSFGQEIEKLIFTFQKADEPPTKQESQNYTLEFDRRASGELVTSYFYENKTRTNLKEAMTIGKERIEKILEWREEDKKTFSQQDLGFDVMNLKNRTSNYSFNFEIP